MSASRKRLESRAQTESIRRASKRLHVLRAALYPDGHWRPTTRGDCEDMERPCPYVGCRHHLAIDVHPIRGSIKLNRPDLEVWEMDDTCSLDVAERDDLTLDELGAILNLSRERVRQIEDDGFTQLSDAMGDHA